MYGDLEVIDARFTWQLYLEIVRNELVRQIECIDYLTLQPYKSFNPPWTIQDLFLQHRSSTK
jgi:hypothetical protein